jgi:glutamine amidotransferase PdxT
MMLPVNSRLEQFHMRYHVINSLTYLLVVWIDTKVRIRTPQQLEGLDGIVLPGGESTAMGLIGTSSGNNGVTMWMALQQFNKPTWGTCAGMILLAEKWVGASAVIENGQALIGGMDRMYSCAAIILALKFPRLKCPLLPLPDVRMIPNIHFRESLFEHPPF